MRSMKILEQALSKINVLNKKQKDFFLFLIQNLIDNVCKKIFRTLVGIDT